MLCSVLAHVLQPESRRQVEVKLHRRQLPRTPDRVNQLHVNLRPVKRRFPFKSFERNLQPVHRARQCRCGAMPVLRLSCVILRMLRIPVRKLHLESEVEACMDFAFAVMKNFGFDKFEVELSDWDAKHPENYTGKPEDWHRAAAALASTMDRLKIPFKRFEGEAAFYGPKIDVKLIDAIGRPWQLTT